MKFITGLTKINFQYIMIIEKGKTSNGYASNELFFTIAA